MSQHFSIFIYANMPSSQSTVTASETPTALANVFPVWRAPVRNRAFLSEAKIVQKMKDGIGFLAESGEESGNRMRSVVFGRLFRTVKEKGNYIQFMAGNLPGT